MSSTDAAITLVERKPALAPPTNHREALAAMRSKAGPVRVPAVLSRGQILDATETCLAELGYDGTTIRAIAKRLDCAVGTIYRYFRDKRSLLTAVTQRRFEPIADAIETGCALSSAADQYATTAREELQQYHLMFWLASADNAQDGNLPEVIDRIITGWARQSGSRDKAEAYWAQLHGRLMLGSDTLSLQPPISPLSPVVASPDSALAANVLSDEQADAAPEQPVSARVEREDVTLL